MGLDMNWAFQEYIKYCKAICHTDEQKKLVDNNLADVYSCFMRFKDPKETLERLNK